MARYTGPRDKISRRFGIPFFGPSKYLERKNYPPGTHGPRARRKYTDYALALMEKQKLRFQYGLMEKQFRSIYEKAHRHRGVTGEIMLQLLECRLDNVIYRLGFGATRAQARQMVSHGHVVVNGGKMTIPSYTAKVNDVVEVRIRAAHASWPRVIWSTPLAGRCPSGCSWRRMHSMEPCYGCLHAMKYSPSPMNKPL